VALVNGGPASLRPDGRPGYLAVHRDWAAGDVLSVEFGMSAGFVAADWRSRDQRGALAVLRGPIVYCAEGHDQPAGLDLGSVRVLPEVRLEASRRAGPLGEHVLLRARARRASYHPDAPLYRDWPPGSRAASRASLADQEELSLIPYYLWANRGRSQMRVWLDALFSFQESLPGTAGLLPGRRRPGTVFPA
jgi:DUF1680 family protein